MQCHLDGEEHALPIDPDGRGRHRRRWLVRHVVRGVRCCGKENFHTLSHTHDTIHGCLFSFFFLTIHRRGACAMGKGSTL